MNKQKKTETNIKNVKYFDDLTISAAFHQHFPCHIQHRKTVCQPDRFSLEMIMNGNVDLSLDSVRVRLEAPCVFRIGELSDHCGFSDPGSFSRAFKRYYRLSPKQWLRRQSDHRQA